jgi:conjugal transfer pilus assembly protein TraW
MRVACLYIALALGGQAHAANLGTWGDLYCAPSPSRIC